MGIVTPHGGFVRSTFGVLAVCFIYLFFAQPVAARSAEGVAHDRLSAAGVRTAEQDAGVLTTLTLDHMGNGAVSAQPTGGTYRYGETVVVNATAAPGSIFMGWEGDLTPPDDWWEAVWDYRVPINVGASGYLRTDKPVEVAVDFGALLTELGTATAFDPNSLRLIEVNAGAEIIDSSIPFQFDDPDNDGVGTLVFLMKGTTAATEGRTYHLYFDIVGKGFTKQNFTDLVTLTDNVMDQGQSSFRVATSESTYFYHKAGGGFSSLVDRAGNDWIDYRNTVGTSGGAFRGIPNMIHPEGEFHPGATGSTSTFVSDGPLKATLRTVTTNGKWEALWEFFPTTVRMTLLKYDHAYWFLYEGTPGGTLETNSDYMVRASGAQSLLSQSWQEDLAGEEWVYFSDPNRDRSLFLAHHLDDTAVDSYRTMSDSNGAMTVFGFGRQNTPSLASRMTQNPATFTFGLIDELNYFPAAQRIYDAYKPLVIEIGVPQQRGQHRPTIPATQSVISVTMTSNRALTAKFEAIPYSLVTSISGGGQIDVMPGQDDFFYSDVVTLTAVADPGWTFTEWQGDAGGTGNPLVITINGNKTITGTFTQIPYTVTVSEIGQGSIALSPEQDNYFYGDTVTLTATPALGWYFSGWSGELTGMTNPAQLTIVDDQQVTATFAQAAYTLTVAVDGEGTVTYNPEETIYRYGDTVTITATPAVGWSFVGWQGDVAGTTNPLSLPMDDNKTLTARFAQNHYGLAVETEGEGTLQVTPEAVDYAHGQQVTLAATPAIGWRFVGWQGDLSGSATPAMLTIDGAKQVTAIFARIAYTLIVEPTVGGTITWSPEQASYQYGDEITFTALPSADYLFAGWGGDLSGIALSTTLTVLDNIHVAAQFTKRSYNVTVSQPVAQGTVTLTPAKTTFEQGEVVTAVATPLPGYRFVRWQLTPDDGTAKIANPLTFTVDKNVTIVPEFVVIEPTVKQLFLPIIVNAATND